MSTAEIRQKLHNYLETAEDKKLEALYTMMEDEIEAAVVTYDKSFLAELDRRHAGYQEGTAVLVSEEESKKRIAALIKKSQ